MLLLVALFLIVFEAVPEGLVLAGHKSIAGALEFIYLSGVTTAIFLWLKDIKLFIYDQRFIKALIGYVLFRFALFDIIYNLSAGLNIFYVGTTKWSDQLISYIPLSILIFLKFIALFWGTAWLLNYKKE